MRLFVSVDPPSPVVEILRGLERPSVPGLRWTAPEQWHVTLSFLGEVADPGPVTAALGEVPGELRRAGAGPPTAVLGPSSAWFPGRQVLQVPVGGLGRLAEAVRVAVLPWTAEPEERLFTGHLTLARMRGGRRGPVALAGVALQASWPVGTVDLMASTLDADGASYQVVSSVALA